MCWWNDMDDDLRTCTDVWRSLHPRDYNPMDWDDPWGEEDDDECDVWKDNDDVFFSDGDI